MSVKRLHVVAIGIGDGVGVSVYIFSLFCVFFLSFNPNLISRNLNQQCIVAIFPDIKKMKAGGAHYFAPSETIASHFSEDSRI